MAQQQSTGVEISEEKQEEGGVEWRLSHVLSTFVKCIKTAEEMAAEALRFSSREAAASTKSGTQRTKLNRKERKTVGVSQYDLTQEQQEQA